MNNFERVKAMTIEELAEFMNDIQDENVKCPCCVYRREKYCASTLAGTPNDINACVYGHMLWLQQEVEHPLEEEAKP